MSDSNKIVAIDSQVLAWGIRRAGDPNMIRRADWLFEQLERDQASIIVPCVAFSEYLTAIPVTKHGGVRAALSKRLNFMPFDIECCSLAAELFLVGQTMRPAGEVDGRKTLRADAMIIATAKMKGARVLYSNDENCRNLADRVMKSEDLPTMGQNLFDV